jgi:mannose-6-phosphate isomerase-like protein (cupin superfamily)
MSVDLHLPFTNPITGETFRCISSSAEAYVTEWNVAPGGFVPFEHIHLAQEEVFHVRAGELRAVIGGRERIVTAGESITMPQGVRQIAFNNKPEVLRCILEYRPGLDSATMFQCFGGLVHDGDIWKSGIANPFKMLYFMRKARARAIARPSYLSGPLFRLMLEVFFIVGSIAGWERLYRKYTGT